MKLWKFAVVGAVCLSTAVVSVQAQGENALPEGRFTVGGRFSDWEQEAILDLLAPVWQSDNERTVVFVNPRGSFVESAEQEANLGVVVRHLAEDRNVIFGVNLFYDRRYTRYDHEFDQLGVGLELLSEWVDARANYYYPEDKKEIIEEVELIDEDRTVWYTASPPYTEDGFVKRDVRKNSTTTVTRRRYVSWEEAQEGFDAEVGVKIPGLPERNETRIFAGYYDFETPFSDIEAKGWKGRLEADLCPGVILDAEVYENKELAGVDFIGGIRVEVPFDLVALSKGKNPFAGAFQDPDRSVSARMAEMVIRDVHVRTAVSGLVEEDVTSSSSSSSQTRTEIIEEIPPLMEEEECSECQDYPEQEFPS